MKKFLQKLDPIAKNPVLTPVLCVLMGVCVGVLSLWFACVDNRTAMFISYFTHPLIALLNILPVAFLSLLLYFLIGRAWISYLLTAALTMGLTFASFYKLTFRNDPMMFEDILLIREAGNMAGKYQLFLNKSMVMALALLVLGLVFLLLFARAKTPWKPRLLCALVTALMAFPLYALYTDANLYNNKTRNEDLISPWSATQVYTSKGFLYPFLYSVRSASDPAPEGYDAKACQEVMAGYTDADIPEEQKVDIFTIQLEAYNDFTKFGVPELNPEVYRVFHELEAESYTGNLVTNIFDALSQSHGAVLPHRLLRPGVLPLPHQLLRLVLPGSGLLRHRQPLLLRLVLQSGEHQRQPGPGGLQVRGELLRGADGRRHRV